MIDGLLKVGSFHVTILNINYANLRKPIRFIFFFLKNAGVRRMGHVYCIGRRGESLTKRHFL